MESEISGVAVGATPGRSPGILDPAGESTGSVVQKCVSEIGKSDWSLGTRKDLIGLSNSWIKTRERVHRYTEKRKSSKGDLQIDGKGQQELDLAKIREKIS